MAAVRKGNEALDIQSGMKSKRQKAGRSAFRVQDASTALSGKSGSLEGHARDHARRLAFDTVEFKFTSRFVVFIKKKKKIRQRHSAHYSILAISAEPENSSSRVV